MCAPCRGLKHGYAAKDTRMALYHHHTGIIGRAQGKAGRSVVAAAAYRAGCKLTDERTGKTWDFERKGSVAYSEILLPPGAPAWAADRSTLWNRVEAAEKRCDAQLAREVEFAIPVEVPEAQRPAWCREHLAAYVEEGMACDFSIHCPPGNPHCHALLTMRRFEGEGFAAKKERTWNHPSRADHHRERYERQVNAFLESIGSRERVSRKSYAERGIDQEPQIHVGAAARAMEAEEPGSSWRVAQNEAVLNRNRMRQWLQQEARKIEEAIRAELRRLAPTPVLPLLTDLFRGLAPSHPGFAAFAGPALGAQRRARPGELPGRLHPRGHSGSLERQEAGHGAGGVVGGGGDPQAGEGRKAPGLGAPVPNSRFGRR